MTGNPLEPAPPRNAESRGSCGSCNCVCPCACGCPSCGCVPTAAQRFVTVAVTGDGKPFAAYGPHETERDADAFGLAHCPQWTVFPLESVRRD